MTFTEAAVEVLRLVGKPLHYKKITEIAIERNLLSHVGKTPEVTMSSRLATMVKKDRGEAPIIKVKPGVFGLRDFPEEVLSAEDVDNGLDVVIPEVEAAEGAESEPVAIDAASNGAAAASEPAPRAARSEHKLPGSEVFPEEEDDDEPILAKLDEESAEDENGKRRKRRRRRRRKGEEEGLEAEGVEPEGDRPERAERAERPARAGRGGDRERGRDRGRGGDRDRGRGGERERMGERVERERAGERVDRDRGRGGREERPGRRREIAGDWHREAGEGETVGRDLADAIAAVLDGLGGQRARAFERVAEELVRRGRLSGDAAALSPTLAAAARGDDARRAARHRRPRFHIEGDELSLLEWSVPSEAARAEQEVERVASRQRELVRRAFIRRLSDLPTTGLMELIATWLNVQGVTSLRGIRRPGATGGDLHLAGVLRQGPLETPLAIVIVRDGSSIGRERVIDIRGALHHYGGASAAWLITLGQVLSGAREESSTSGAAPCGLFDGVELARSMEQAGVGLREYVVPVVALDVGLLDSLRGPGAKLPPRRERVEAPREAERVAVVEVEADEEPVTEEISAETEEAGGEAGNGRRKRRRRRRRGGAEGGEAAGEAGETEAGETEAGEIEAGETATEAEPEAGEIEEDVSAGGKWSVPAAMLDEDDEEEPYGAVSDIEAEEREAFGEEDDEDEPRSYSDDEDEDEDEDEEAPRAYDEDDDDDEDEDDAPRSGKDDDDEDEEPARRWEEE